MFLSLSRADNAKAPVWPAAGQAPGSDLALCRSVASGFDDGLGQARRIRKPGFMAARALYQPEQAKALGKARVPGQAMRQGDVLLAVQVRLADIQLGQRLLQ